MDQCRSPGFCSEPGRYSHDGSTKRQGLSRPQPLTLPFALFANSISVSPMAPRTKLTGLLPDPTQFLVRKGIYAERYDTRPWEKAGRQDLLAEALGADMGDGNTLLVVLRKGLRAC